MNAIAQVSVDTSFTIALPNAAPEAGRASAAVSAHMYDAQSGMGAMQGSQIRVGSGTASGPAAFSQLPNEVQQAAADVRLQAPRTPQARQAVLERPAARPQPSLSTSALYVSRPGGLATSFAVLETLVKHADEAGTKLTREEIKGYVALGEHAVHALQQPSALARRLGETVVHSVNPPLVLSPNLETARGISWYVAACAAQQDVNQKATRSATVVNGEEVTNLTLKGAFVFKDPNNAIHNFLQSSPLAYSRISSHFHERSASEIGFLGPDQRGIEDYDRRLPGQNGAMLFDKLKGEPGKEEMFFKIESKGFPDVFSSSKRVDDQGMGRGTFWKAFKRWIGHCINFVTTRNTGAGGVDRKEHVHKGLLKTPVHEPFMQVVKSAAKLGLVTDVGKHAEQAEKIGLPHLESTLAELKTAIGGVRELSNEHVALFHGLVEAQLAIVTAKAELGAQSDHLGIKRRGAETHIDLNSPQVHRQEAHKNLVALEPELSTAQDLLVPYTPPAGVTGKHTIPAGVNIVAVKDWNRNGFAVNGTVYPGQGNPGNVSSHQDGESSTLEQGCSAFVQACGGNPVAAEWISRFAHQGLAVPMLQYLNKEPLGTVGNGVLVSSGTQRFAIDTLPDGAVELTMDYRYQNSEEDPKPLLVGEDLVYMDKRASLSATVTLRFDNPAAYTSTEVPVPVISAPLTYTTSHFSRK